MLTSTTAAFLLVALLAISSPAKANRAGTMPMHKLKFCDYILRINAFDAHCNPAGTGRSVKQRKPAADSPNDPPADSTVEPAPLVPPTNKSADRAPAFKQCFLKYNKNHCLRSNSCESNLLCVDVKGDPCCVATPGNCPTVQQLGIVCVRSKPTNWCDTHTDCGRGSLCCDSGCSYNVCVN
ncbi:WAP domain-containing protein [Aphelenchoides fujianensis]|nr:WAP domain-containing protein [Aphelenchoides fujianensis]